ncbi:hypothetical protein ACTI_73140 [Actinoplanes sp. OR16]|uniref:hypothetical protein n=1 Tax=Actinoplanes sp. OR16 TaxID=946334 RepID=UPI000F6DF5D3|nr:hypothetical protein [Actinoplanes sp. OR16]BBH70629.1 hypothetical protein ACTI_73140 [Actinoplanes sp. OR16]
MWPQPVTDLWTLAVAACPHRVDDVLADLGLHRRARPAADPDFPARLIGPAGPDRPPAWMELARAELERRGFRTRRHPSAGEQQPRPRCAGAPATGPREPRAGRREPARAPLRRLIESAPYHRRPAPMRPAA